MIHLNPVFSPDDLSLKELSAWMPTVGIRDAEDLPTAIGFARFADGSASLNDLEAYLAVRRDAFLRQAGLS